MIIPNSLRRFFEAVFLGSVVSSVGNKSMGTFMWNPSKREDLETLKGLVDAGKIKPLIDRRYELSKVPEAFRYLEEGRARGKVVITV